MLVRERYSTAEHVKKLRRLLGRCEHENNLRIWKRAKSVLLYLKDKRPDEISDLLDVGLKSVYRWLDQYGRQEVDGLYEGHHTGRPPLLTKAQLARLEEILDSGPVAYGLTTGIWTSLLHFNISLRRNLGSIITTIMCERFSIRWGFRSSVPRSN